MSALRICRFALICTIWQSIDIIGAVHVNDHHVYYDHDERTLLHWIKVAERDLRFYIYPMPQFRENEIQRECGGHFGYECGLPNYLRSLKANIHPDEPAGSRDHFVVDNPNEANAFIIEMYWSIKAFVYPGEFSNCSDFIEHRLRPTIETVVDKHPYYNRSGGRDHFMMSSIDNGIFGETEWLMCGSWKTPESERTLVRQLMDRIANVSLIQNGARDSKLVGIRKHEFDRNHAFIVDQDIVISQPLPYDNFIESHRREFMAWRPFDSSFEGSSHGDRMGLAGYKDHRYEQYLHKGLESFTGQFYPSFNGNRLRRSYFSYQACGLGYCWSQRLFESMAARSIPILQGSELVMPFEKFLNWAAFTVKMTASTWHNDTGKADDFRKALRYESDLFRLRLFDFYESVGINIDFHGTQPIEHLITPELIAKAANNDALQELQNTMIWRKMENLHSVFPWFYFNGTEDSYIVPWKHPFKLIQLEIWCRITNFEYRQRLRQHREAEDLCLRPSNYIASSEYV